MNLFTKTLAVILLSNFLLGNPEVIFAQITFQKKIHSVKYDEANDIKTTPDSGYIVAGLAWEVHQNGKSISLVNLKKCDKSGTVLWDKAYTIPFGSDTGVAYGYCVRPTTDNGYIVVGNVTQYTGLTQIDQGLYIVKTNSSGNLQWSKRIMGEIPYQEKIYSIQETNDGGYIMVGESQSFSGGNNMDIYLIKLNASGDITWTKTFGENGNPDKDSSQSGRDVKQTADGGFVIAGNMSSYYISGNTGPVKNGGCALLKTDASGNLQWVKTYFDSLQSAGSFESVEQTPDKGFITTGHSSSDISAAGKAWLVKTDSLGNVKWNKCYSNGGWSDHAHKVYITSDGAYVIGGSTTGPLNGFVPDPFEMLIKTDTTGNVIWAKKYGANFSNDNFGSFTPSLEGGYALVNTTYSTITNSNNSRDIYFVKTDTNGNVGGCQFDLSLTVTSPQLVVDTVQMIVGAGATVAVNAVSYERAFIWKDSTACFQSSVNADFNAQWPRCEGDSIYFYNTSNVSFFQWNFGDPVSGISNTSILQNPGHMFSAIGTYSVTLIAFADASLLRSDTITQVVTVFPNTFMTVMENITVCSGSSVTLSASDANVYYWSPGWAVNNSTIANPIASPTTTTTYSVIGYNAGNCSDTASITITVNPSPTLTVSGETSVCSGRSVNLVASGSGNSYLWSTGASTTSITVSPINDSTYSATTFIEGCSDSATHIITVIPNTSISAGADQTVLSGTKVTLLPSGGASYHWETKDGVVCTNCNSQTVKPTQTTTYYLTETSSGCAEDSVTIYVLNCSDLFVPNAFSPNNDGYNDVLYLKYDCLKELNFSIYDRWGNKVFESMNVANGWDGMYKGKVMDSAVFVYYLEGILEAGNVISRKGNISLVR